MSPWPGRRTGSGWCWRSLVQVGGGGPRQAARHRRPPVVVRARRSGSVARRDRPCSRRRGSGGLRARCPGFSWLTALAGTTAGLLPATRTPASSPAAYPRQPPAATAPPGFLSQQWTHDGSRARQGGPNVDHPSMWRRPGAAVSQVHEPICFRDGNWVGRASIGCLPASIGCLSAAYTMRLDRADRLNISIVF